MKTFVLTTLISACTFSLSAQFVAKMEVKEPIEGLCNQNEVYALLSMFEGQKKAVCPISDEEILKRLNAEVQFVKDNPNYKDKGMIGLIVNCKGELVQCRMDNKTKSTVLDQQIEAVFKTLVKWKPGKLNGKKVDSSVLVSFKIKKGVFVFEI